MSYWKLTTLGAIFGCAFVLSSFADEMFDQGKSLFESGEYALARERLAAYLASHPDDPQALFYMGRTELDGVKSQEYFRLILEGYPEHELADDALFQIAQFWYAKGYYVTAQQHFLRLLREYPQSNLADRCLYRIGLTFLAIDEPELAEKEFGKLLKQYPESEMRICAELGIVESYYAREEYRTAISLGEGLLDSAGPLKSHLLYLLAESYRKIEEEEKAEEILARILTECPDSYEATLVQGFSPTLLQVSSAEPDSAGRYSIQAGAFENIANATALHNRLTADGLEVRLKTKVVNEKLLYLVMVGPYTSREEAEAAAQAIKKNEGVNCLILEVR